MAGEARTRQMLKWAAGGLMFTVNSLIAARTIRDGGLVAALSGLVAVVLLLVPLFGVIAEDLRSGRANMHELVVVAVFASCIQGDFTTSACIALFLMLSVLIETKTASGAQASLTALARLTPGKAHRREPVGRFAGPTGFPAGTSGRKRRHGSGGSQSTRSEDECGPSRPAGSAPPPAPARIPAEK